MEGDELFDSLDDYSSASSASLTESRLQVENRIASITTCTSSESCFSNARDISTHTICEAKHSCDITSLVPLYGGDVIKNSISLHRKSTSTPMLNKILPKNSETASVPCKDAGCSCYIDGSSKIRQKRRFKFSGSSTTDIPKIIQVGPIKSYLSIFHSRIGYPDGKNKPKSEDTTRSVFGDTDRSLLSIVSPKKQEFQDAEDHDSDTSSFYFNHIQSEQICEKGQLEINFDGISPQLSPSTTTEFTSNITSVSELFIAKNHKKPIDTRKLPPKYIRNPIPVMGGLGPDTTALHEKLERRKRQLSYGQKASNHNRIKIVEMKVLKNLKSEIQKSHLLDEAHNTGCIDLISSK